MAPLSILVVHNDHDLFPFSCSCRRSIPPHVKSKGESLDHPIHGKVLYSRGETQANDRSIGMGADLLFRSRARFTIDDAAQEHFLWFLRQACIDMGSAPVRSMPFTCL